MGNQLTWKPTRFSTQGASDNALALTRQTTVPAHSTSFCSPGLCRILFFSSEEYVRAGVERHSSLSGRRGIQRALLGQTHLPSPYPIGISRTNGLNVLEACSSPQSRGDATKNLPLSNVSRRFVLPFLSPHSCILCLVLLDVVVLLFPLQWNVQPHPPLG